MFFPFCQLFSIFLSSSIAYARQNSFLLCAPLRLQQCHPNYRLLLKACFREKKLKELQKVNLRVNLTSLHLILKCCFFRKKVDESLKYVLKICTSWKLQLQFSQIMIHEVRYFIFPNVKNKRKKLRKREYSAFMVNVFFCGGEESTDARVFTKYLWISVTKCEEKKQTRVHICVTKISNRTFLTRKNPIH